MTEAAGRAGGGAGSPPGRAPSRPCPPRRSPGLPGRRGIKRRAQAPAPCARPPGCARAPRAPPPRPPPRSQPSTASPAGRRLSPTREREPRAAAHDGPECGRPSGCCAARAPPAAAAARGGGRAGGGRLQPRACERAQPCRRTQGPGAGAPSRAGALRTRGRAGGGAPRQRRAAGWRPRRLQAPGKRGPCAGLAAPRAPADVTRGLLARGRDGVCPKPRPPPPPEPPHMQTPPPPPCSASAALSAAVWSRRARAGGAAEGLPGLAVEGACALQRCARQAHGVPPCPAKPSVLLWAACSPPCPPALALAAQGLGHRLAVTPA